MADNITLPTTGTGTATPVIATDDVSGVHYQIVKLTVGALDSAGSVLVGGNGPVTAGSQRVALGDIGTGEYEAVAASATNQILGASGSTTNTGDYLLGLLIIPATTSPGAVTIKDGSATAITVFTGGATSVSNLVPFMVPLGIYSVTGSWQVTTGTNVSAIGIGNFT